MTSDKISDIYSDDNLKISSNNLLLSRQGNESIFSDTNNNNAKQITRDDYIESDAVLKQQSIGNEHIENGSPITSELLIHNTKVSDIDSDSQSVKSLTNNDKDSSLYSLREFKEYHQHQYRQMQQLLQQHVFTPHQLQQLMKHHQSFCFHQQQQQHHLAQMTMSSNTPKDQHHQQFHFESTKKQLEQLMQQIQEQLQMNLLQQTHLLQQSQHSPTNQKTTTNAERKANKHSASSPVNSLTTIHLQQKLALQQQELIQQFQLVQRQYFLHQGGIGLQPLLLAQQQQLQSEFFQQFSYFFLLNLVDID